MPDVARRFYRRYLKGTPLGRLAVQCYAFSRDHRPQMRLGPMPAIRLRGARVPPWMAERAVELRRQAAAQRRALAKSATAWAGEALAWTSRRMGTAAARLLFKAHWGYGAPEWFDARLGLLYPEKWFTDGSHVSRGSIVGVLPVGGSLLDLCGGDGFLPYYVYSRRASRIVSVDHDPAAHRHAVRHHSKRNIEYVLSDVFSFDAGAEQYDVVVIRGAIEHFTEADQLRIFRLAWRALKKGGWFCGDTPANTRGGPRLLEHHHDEWRDEAQMRALLGTVFPHIETMTFQSCEAVSYSKDDVTFPPENLRTSLIWRCRKDG